MELIKIKNRKAEIRFSSKETATLSQALNEVCNGIRVLDFEEKIGVSREEARMLLSSIRELRKQMRSSKDTKSS